MTGVLSFPTDVRPNRVGAGGGNGGRGGRGGARCHRCRLRRGPGMLAQQPPPQR